MIRRLVASDLDAAIELERLCFDPPWSRSALATEFARAAATSLGVETPGTAGESGLVATAFFASVVDEAELLRLAVHPEHRGQGIGSRLLRAGLQRLHDAGVVTCHLEVEAGNAAAIALYGSVGFEEVGRRLAYYANGVDALLFRCSPAIIPPRSGRGDSSRHSPLRRTRRT